MTSRYLNNKIFCLIGPSGTGKDAIKNSIPVPHIVSYRTRPKRDFEMDGVHGHFIEEKEFQMFKDHDLIAAETLYSGYHYGILWEQLADLENHPLLYVVDMGGVETLRESLKKDILFSENQVVTIYIDSTVSSLKKRMKKQGRTKSEIKQRLKQMEEVDFPAAMECDYIVSNDQGTLEEAIHQIQTIILEEQYRRFK